MRLLATERQSDRKGDAGFTLIELLVSLALMALLSVLLLDGVRSGLSSWQRSARLAGDIDEMLTVQSFLRRLVEDAYPLYVLDENRRGYVEFEGSAQSISFLSSTPAALGGAGRTKYRLSIEQQNGQRNLVLSHQMELSGPNPSSETPHRTLLSNVETVTFSYFSKGATNSDGQWGDSWARQARLPQLVRIQVSFPQGESRSWPDLVVLPRITVDVGCVYDPLTKACRGR